jgi:hypothetical protein
MSMDKQAEAKVAQQYTRESPRCGNCKHHRFDMVMPAWMAAQNKSGQESWGKEHEQPKNRRCGIGGFGVVAAGHCQKYEAAA